MAIASVPLPPYDEMHKCLLQAEALLMQTYGGGGESFRNMHDDDQDHFLWAVADKVREAIKFAEALEPES